MRIGNIESRTVNGQVELSARVSVDCLPGESFKAWVRFPAEFGEPPALGDPFAAAFVLTSMFDGEDLHVEAPVSEKLVSAIPRIQHMFRTWYPDELSTIGFFCGGSADQPDKRRASGVGYFFSGGVDSWYSLLANRERITHLVTVRGFDIREVEVDLWKQMTETARAVAEEHGKSLVLVETNLRELTDKSDPLWGRRSKVNFWAAVSHGSALAAVGLSLGRQLNEVIIPSSYSVAQLARWGSHPLTDTLFSTESVIVTHDSCEVTRMEKVAALAKSPLALRTLRVCWHNQPGAYNCCRCEKCRRTMLALAAFGVLESAGSFHLPLNLHEVKLMDRPEHLNDLWYREILDCAKDRGETKIADAIGVLLGDRLSLERRLGRAGMWLKRLGRKIVHRKIRQAAGTLVKKHDR